MYPFSSVQLRYRASLVLLAACASGFTRNSVFNVCIVVGVLTANALPCRYANASFMMWEDCPTCTKAEASDGTLNHSDVRLFVLAFSSKCLHT
jgi:hypothetical protein